MTKLQLAGRLAICQIFGTFAAIIIAIVWSYVWASAKIGFSFSGLGITFFVGMLIGIPFYCVALLVLHNFTSSILRHPFVWCIAGPALLLIGMLYEFPPQVLGGIFWMTIIPMAALIAGTIFYVWLWRSSIIIGKNQPDPLPKNTRD